MTVLIFDALLEESQRDLLKQHILSLSKASDGVSTNMNSGYSFFDNKWLSPRDLHQQPQLQTICDQILATVHNCARKQGISKRYHFHTMWAIVSEPSMSGKPHTHEGELSGVYYVDAADSGASGGQLVVHTPQGKAHHTPRSNQMLLFPSNTLHSVTPYTSATSRIVLPFNLKS